MPDLVRRPDSAVSARTGAVGLTIFVPFLAGAILLDLSLLVTVALLLAGPATGMILHDLAVEKVHRRPSTGLDFARRNPPAETRTVVATKFIGLCATFAGVAAIYAIVPFYRGDSLYLILAAPVATVLLAISPLYLAYTSRRMIEPRDELWAFGRFVIRFGREGDREAVAAHLRGWAVKAFFLAFMVSILPDVARPVIGLSAADLLQGPVAFVAGAVALLFLVDVTFGTIGYLLTFRVLDSHIRSANPFLAGWVFALICYPPFALIGHGALVDYSDGGQGWAAWLDGHPVLLSIWGAAIVALAFVYAWATTAFGIRFSNLTHRGIVTAGPYRWVRHPAYLSKNAFWWLMAMPFLSLQGPFDALQNSALLVLVNLVYLARARTEERHLMADPDYRAYCDWIAVHGLRARLGRRLADRRGDGSVPRPGLARGLAD